MIMESTSVQEILEEIQGMLTDLSRSEQDIEPIVSRLGGILYHCAQSQASERNLAFDLGIVKALLGILRCSSSNSLIGKVVGCLALLVHGNQEGRERLGSVNSFFQLLMKHLSPSVSESVGLEAMPRVSWDLSRTGVYEQVLSVLQKLTYLSGDNQIRLAQCGGVKLIINLATSSVFLRNSGHFSLESKQCLERLTLGKKLACKATFVPESCSGAVLSSFDALSGDYAAVTAQYPAFYMSLATEDKKWIGSAMIEEGVVWPDHTPFPAEGSKWTWVTVTSVENGSNVWCRFCREKADPRMKRMQESLENMPPPLSNSFDDSDLSLAPSDVYAAYYDPVQLSPSSPCFLSSAQWCRARLLRILPDLATDGSRLIIVLAVDYGFMMTLPESQLAPLPPECRGIPPQAVPCKLMGVAPLPPRASILEAVAGILRNLSFENDACRAEIAAQRGIEALLELYQCPNEGIVQQSIGALLNLSVSKKMRAQLGQRGAITVLLRVCQQSTISENLLDQSLHCLLNLLIQCSENTVRFSEADGYKVIKTVEARYQHNTSITKCIGSLRRHLQGPSQPSTNNSGLLMDKSVPYEHLRAEHKPIIAHQPGHSQTGAMSQVSESSCRKRSPSKPSPQKEKRQLYEARRRANGERVLPNPVYRCLGDTTDETMSENSSETDDDELLIEDGNREAESEASGGVVRSRCYLVNCALPGGPERDTRSFVPVEDVTRVSRRGLRRCICSMMNLGKTATIFVGVRRDGIVKGIKLNKEQRDKLCIGIDSLMTDFEPIITANLYSIHFVPVAVQLNGSKRLAIAEGYFVVELTLLESPCRQIYTISEKDSNGELYDRCYYRMSSCNVQLSHQELRDIVAWEVANSYSSEVRSLEARLSDLKMRHHSSAVD